MVHGGLAGPPPHRGLGGAPAPAPPPHPSTSTSTSTPSPTSILAGADLKVTVASAPSHAGTGGGGRWSCGAQGHLLHQLLHQRVHLQAGGGGHHLPRPGRTSSTSRVGVGAAPLASVVGRAASGLGGRVEQLQAARATIDPTQAAQTDPISHGGWTQPGTARRARNRL